MIYLTKHFRPFLIVFYIGCSLYPPLELSRVIIQSGRYYYPELANTLWAEVSAIWFFYIMSIALLSTVLFFRRAK